MLQTAWKFPLISVSGFPLLYIVKEISFLSIQILNHFFLSINPSIGNPHNLICLIGQIFTMRNHNDTFPQFMGRPL